MRPVFNCTVNGISLIQCSRRVLTYLIPLRILRGHLPSEELLERFPLLSEIYSPFITALRTANLRAYDEALYRWEKQLLELNVWLVFERARELVLRGLFRRVLVNSHTYHFIDLKPSFADGR